ncbi:MAG: hypothetical protein KAJ42_16680, partial [Gemmatimonadetes bacterium]|nr:hypothetical protein [Gemmatimonadota bacterium]
MKALHLDRRFSSFAVVFVLAALFLPGLREPALAQSAESLLTLERIFSSGEFTSERFGPARWIDGGDGYTTLEMS